jgi:hypothetical protein
VNAVVERSTLPPPADPRRAVVYVVATRPSLAARVQGLLGVDAEVVAAARLETVLRQRASHAGSRESMLIDARAGALTGVIGRADLMAELLDRMRVILWSDDPDASDAIGELARARGRADRVVVCSADMRAEDVALLLELHLDPSTWSTPPLALAEGGALPPVR